MSLKVSNIKLQASSLQTSNAVNNRINGLEKCSYILTTSSPDNKQYYLSYRNGTKVLSSDLQFNNIILNNVNVILNQAGTPIKYIKFRIRTPDERYDLSFISFPTEGKIFLNRQLLNNTLSIDTATIIGNYIFEFTDEADGEGSRVALLPETLNSITIDVIC